MKQTLSAILIGLMACGSAFGLATQKTNSVNLVLANVCDGTFNDFKFQVSGYDDQVFSFNYDQSLTGVAASFRITKPMDGTIYLDVPITSVTVSGTNILFSIARTNIPPPGSYYGELLSYEANSTNYYRSLAQGKIPVTWSLYLNESNFFARATNTAGVGQVYVHPNWIDPPWLSSTSALGAVYFTLANSVILSNWTDTINTKATNNLASITALQGASNALQVQVGALQVASNSLNSSVTNLQISTNYLNDKATNWDTAYGWGNHASAGYLSTSTNLFNDIYSANRSVLGTNIAGLTQGTHTGSLTSVSYTGVTVMTVGRMYEYGFTKANAFGTSTLSIASHSLSKTAAGSFSNYFAFTGTDTNLILKLDGDGSSKSDVSAVYLKQITNGDVNIANNLNVGGTLLVDGAALVNQAANVAALQAATNAINIGYVAADAIITNLIRITSNAFVAADTVVRSELTNTITIVSNAFVSADSVLRSELTNTITVASNALSSRIDGVTNGAALGESAVQDGDTLTLGLSHAGTAYNGYEYPNADWVRGLFQIGNPIYHTTNQDCIVGFEPTNYTFCGYSENPTYTNTVSITVTGANQYVIAMITTQAFTGDLLGPASVETYVSRTNDGPADSIKVKVELYYTYDRTNLLGDWSVQEQTVTFPNTNKYLWTIPFNNTTVTGAYVVARLKVTSVNNVNTLRFSCGSEFPSHVMLRQVGSETLGIRGGTNLTFNGNWTTSSYDTVTRTFAVSNPGYASTISSLNNATGALNTSVGNLNAATNNLAGRVATIEGQPTNLWAISGATNIAAGASDSYTVATRTLTWNTNAAGGGSGSGTFDHTALTNQDGSTNFLHLSQSQKDLATNYFIGAAGTNMAIRPEGGTSFFDNVYNDSAILLATNDLNIKTRILATNTPTLAAAISVSNQVAVNTTGKTDLVTYNAGMAAQANTNALKLDASFTNDAKVTALQITGASSNTAIWRTTNTAGQGTVTFMPFLSATSTGTYTFANGAFNRMTFDKTINQLGGTWDGKTWTPGIVGKIGVASVVRFNGTASASAQLQIGLYKNGAVRFIAGFKPFNATEPWTPVLSTYDFCESITNTYEVWIGNYTGLTQTNEYWDTPNTWVNFIVLP